MPSNRPQKRRPDESEDRSSASGRQAKRKGGRREPSYETYDEAIDGGVEMQEKAERYRDGEKAQRFYERALELYRKAYEFQSTYDAVYNQAGVLFTLGTSFLLPPLAVSHLQASIELYRLSTTLTNSPLLLINSGYNLAQALTGLADITEDLEDDTKIGEVRAMRQDAARAFDDVFQGQEEYLRQTAEDTDMAEAEAVVDDVAGEADSAMDLDKQGSTLEPDDEQETFETYLPTPTALIDTVLLLVEIHLSLWESRDPPLAPSEAEQTVVRSLLDRAATFVPPGRQAELDLAEIRVLLSMDRVVWDIFKAEARPGTGIEKSLEGAIGALGALLTSLDIFPPEDQNVRADILTTMAEPYSTVARRMLFLTPHLPPGPSPLAQQAWYHFSGATTNLTAALDLPTSGFTPKTFKPSILLSLSKTSLARARLAGINETAKRNSAQLMENAVNYASRAIDGLGWKGFASTSTSGTRPELPWQAGWDTELLARNCIFQQLRICYFGSTTDLGPESRTAFDARRKGLIEVLRSIPAGERRLGRTDAVRWVDECEEEGGVEEREREWWKVLAEELDA